MIPSAAFSGISIVPGKFGNALQVFDRAEFLYAYSAVGQKSHRFWVKFPNDYLTQPEQRVFVMRT